MDNHEPWSVPGKGLQRTKKQSVLEFFVSIHSVSFLPTKIRQILFQIVLRLLQIFLPDTLHNIVMMRNVQCRVYVGPGLPVKLGVSAFKTFMVRSNS